MFWYSQFFTGGSTSTLRCILGTFSFMPATWGTLSVQSSYFISFATWELKASNKANIVTSGEQYRENFHLKSAVLPSQGRAIRYFSDRKYFAVLPSKSNNICSVLPSKSNNICLVLAIYCKTL
jgi:hypothetical protein